MNRQQSLGAVAALVSAMAFALNVTLVPIAYDSGANVHAVNLVRPLTFLACMLIAVRLGGVSLRLPRMDCLATMGLGVLMCVELYALLGAIQFIPVALAILTLYLYPLIIACVEHALGRTRIGLIRGTAMLVTFGGLAMVINAPVEAPDLRGLGLAFGAALGLAAMVWCSEHVLKPHDHRVVMVWMVGTTSLVVTAIVLVAQVELTWPRDDGGWWALMASAACYVFATFLLFKAVAWIGPLRTGVMDTSAPVWALVFGTVLLDQSLSGLQIAGAILVVAGIIIIQARSHSEASEPAT
jgi:drug/metabolite transporter (DMT)-like permease